ncbi:hypothetical protein K2X30_13500 [bacterium]|nr:hypothetical protein [bacterium]
MKTFFSLLLLVASTPSWSAEFCLGSIDDRLPEIDLMPAAMSSCEGNKIVVGGGLMAGSKRRAEMMSELTERMSQLGYAPIGTILSSVIYEKGAQAADLPVCTISKYTTLYRLHCSGNALPDLSVSSREVTDIEVLLKKHGFSKSGDSDIGPIYKGR